MKHIWIAAGVITIATTAGFAHQGVQNPTVLARMEGMSELADQVEVLGNMARGITAFDAEAANAALAALAGEANRIIDLFEEPATDPQSEARAGIWDNFADFSQRAMELEILASELSGTIEDRDSVVTTLRRVGAQCSGCHEDYRIESD